MGKYVFMFLDNEPNSAFKVASVGKHLLAVGRNIAIESIDVHELQPGEIPSELHDPEAFLKKMEAGRPRVN